MTEERKMTSQRDDKILIDLDPRTSPVSWLNSIFAKADYKSADLIARHLVAAVLQKAHPNLDVRVSTARAGYVDSKSSGVVTIVSLTYHVTTKPTAGVIRGCEESLSTGHIPILLVPNAEINRVVALAKESMIVNRISIFGIEDYVSLDIIMICCDKKVEAIETFKDILREYNWRIHTTETDQSLKIELL